MKVTGLAHVAVCTVIIANKLAILNVPLKSSAALTAVEEQGHSAGVQETLSLINTHSCVFCVCVCVLTCDKVWVVAALAELHHSVNEVGHVVLVRSFGQKREVLL